MLQKRCGILNALAVANTGFQLAGFFDKIIGMSRYPEKVKDMLKQRDMTETARFVFNELSVSEPPTVGDSAQNAYLPRERCQLLLTQLVIAGLMSVSGTC
ncbi:hypothetical protein FVV84_07105 [Escherichia coli]|nr:hypothetical protein [Escherichia coli]EFN6004058.1 hypothetical protein [Escherichia coli]